MHSTNSKKYPQNGAETDLKYLLGDWLVKEGVSRSYRFGKPELATEDGPGDSEVLYFGLYERSGEARFEVKIEWKDDRGITVPFIEMPSRAWNLFWFFSNLFESFGNLQCAEGNPISRQKIVKFLELREFKELKALQVSQNEV